MTNAVNIAQLGSNNVTMRNRIINGAMMIDQRNAGASVTNNTSGQYTLDRWFIYGDQSSKFTVQQNAGSVTPPAGFKNYLGVTSLSSYTVGASEIFVLQQMIEGYNIADLGWGTANAQPVTLSFWVRSSLTGTFGGSLKSGGSTTTYPFTYTITAANTWEQKSITVAGDTTGTWLSTNGIGIRVGFGLGCGSNESGTAGVWASTNYSSATGATSVVGTNGATFYITGVQLEEGTAASPFENRLYGTELALCQRYYNKVLGTGSGLPLFMRWVAPGAGNGIPLNYTFKSSMRAAPTWTKIGTWSSSNCNQPIFSASTTEYVTILAEAAGSGDSYVYANNVSMGFDISSEL
jgi:hypothetical protein